MRGGGIRGRKRRRRNVQREEKKRGMKTVRSWDHKGKEEMEEGAGEERDVGGRDKERD